MDYRKIRAEALRQGWRIERTKKGERFVPPDPGQQAVQAHGTPSDRRRIKNLISDLRRSGLLWPPPRS